MADKNMYLKIESKAYGCYSGSYDGGGVSGDLYWDINAARDRLNQIQ